MAADDDTTSLLALDLRAATRDRVPALVGLSEGTPGLTILRDEETVVGRATECGLRLTVPGVSRRHAKLIVESSRSVTLVDLRSRNGTSVNARRIDVAQLSEGDEIHFGPIALFRFDRTVVGDLAQIGGPEPRTLEGLTPREAEVAFAVAEGLTNAAIAGKLGVKPRTVISHLEHVFRKLEIGSRTELVRLVLAAEPSSSRPSNGSR